MPLWVRTIAVTALPDDAAPAIAAHRAEVARLAGEGRIRAAGSFPGDEGFLEIFEAKDRLEAEAVAHASPIVEAGVGIVTLREWRDEGASP